MGDRCFLTMTLRKEDLESLLTFLGTPIPEERTQNIEHEFNECEDVLPGVVRITEYEANYAWYSELEAFGQAGYVFYGSHTAGGEYEAGLFAAHDGDVVWVDSTDHSSKPVIAVYPYGLVPGATFNSIVNYYRVFRRAYTELHADVPPYYDHRPNDPHHILEFNPDGYKENEVVVCVFNGTRLVRL